MGNSNTSEEIQKNFSLAPSPSPSDGRGFVMHAPLVEGEFDRSDSVTSIHNEMNDILNMVSRIIVCYIKNGLKEPLKKASQEFDESLFLKKKYV